DLEAAVDTDGTILALRMHVIANVGAYPIFTFIPDLTLSMGIGVYRITNVDLRSTCVLTNTTPVAAYRGAGRPEAAYYLERLVDCIAAELKHAPEVVRRRNFIPPDAFPYQAPTGQRYDSGQYDRALTKALQLAHVDDLRKEQRVRLERRDRHLLGVGMSCYVEMCGFGPFESAVVRVEPGGMVTAFTGTSAHGQGHETTFAGLRALRERGGPRGARRDGDRVHRHVRPRPGSRDDLRPDHRRSSRRGLRPRRRPSRRHPQHADGQRHRGQSQPRRRRHRDPQCDAESAGQGQASGRAFDGSGARGHRRRRRRLSRAWRAGPRR